MAELSKEQKKALMRKATYKKKYILGKAKVCKLFYCLETRLKSTPCDHTLRYTEQWLMENVPYEKIKSVIAEMEEMGGYCDCEVLLNCYEAYDLA